MGRILHTADFAAERAADLMSVLWKDVVEGRAGRPTRWTLGPLLTILAWPYDLAHRLRLQAYTRSWLSRQRLPCRVLSVGNLTLGGTGKTPLVEVIATWLQARGCRVGVLSRGYGRKGGGSIVVASDGAHVLRSPEEAGDEPVLLAEHLPGVPIIVGKDRFAAGMLAVERFGVDVLVLDDGFQHVSLARDLDILLLDAAHPLGNGRLFPRGDLREPPSALARADAIVFTRWDPTIPTPALPHLPHPTPPLLHSQHEPVDLHGLHDGQTLPLASLRNRRVLAFCGIGAPASFRCTLEELGATVVAFRAFSDHHRYTRPELEALTRLAASVRAEMVITTEKDRIRLRRFPALQYPMWELRIRARIVDQGPVWERCLLG
ncbi:MAG: tetraacyldisaccharide 4'-kinase [Candidatus Entotheonellia bacterium]